MGVQDELHESSKFRDGVSPKYLVSWPLVTEEVGGSHDLSAFSNFPSGYRVMPFLTAPKQSRSVIGLLRNLQRKRRYLHSARETDDPGPITAGAKPWRSGASASHRLRTGSQFRVEASKRASVTPNLRFKTVAESSPTSRT